MNMHSEFLNPKSRNGWGGQVRVVSPEGVCQEVDNLTSEIAELVSQERGGRLREVDENEVCTDGRADLMGLSWGGGLSSEVDKINFEKSEICGKSDFLGKFESFE
jgi:hypothetical protein